MEPWVFSRGLIQPGLFFKCPSGGKKGWFHGHAPSAFYGSATTKQLLPWINWPLAPDACLLAGEFKAANMPVSPVLCFHLIITWDFASDITGGKRRPLS